MGKAHAAALVAQRQQGRVALHARARQRHRMAPAHQVDTLRAAVDVGVHKSQVAQHAVAPGACIGRQQRAALSHRQRVIGAQHGGARHRTQALVHGIDVAQGAVADFAIAHVVPTFWRAGACQQRLVNVHVGHQPGRVLQKRGGFAQGGRGFLQHTRGHEQRQRQHHRLRAPMLKLRAGLVPGQHLDTVARLAHAQHRACGVHTIGQRRGQALHQPGVAFGPGEDRLAFCAVVTGRGKAMPAGEIVQPGPG